MSVCIENVRAVFPGERVVATDIRFEDGKVAAVGDAVAQPDDTVVDGRNRLLTPGLVDVHVHGITHYAFDNGPDDLLAAAECFPQFGTTTVIPTVVPRQGDEMLPKLSALAGALDRVDAVNMPGFHLEGPFTALPGAGLDVLPGDVGLLDELLAACRKRVQVMSVSPETPNILPVIERLCEEGIVPFVTHTRATVAQTQAAIAAGARHATHFYDVFPIPAENDPGVRPVGAVEVFLTDGRTTVDFIADGCHVDPVAIELAVRAKTCQGVVVITDGNIGSGLPPGEYETPGGFHIRTEPGNGARVADSDHPNAGMLAGSELTMNVAMSNMLKWVDAPPEMIWGMGTLNPARAAGLKETGQLAVGQYADAVLWNEDFTPAMTWVRGQESGCGTPGAE